ncbi:TetR/AcrR family transcriptional regulator [Microvirga calopogonii]|uniref:TetR/AcrR family transcriptional regulator n=1 Tax=Microvirga calopogonii TaxID=2078013 RepID=UPI000E0D32CB|nr:TetR family transcriptional regulator [Microvirga calopogonii]
MVGRVRGRKSSREKILDAAAELVSEIGSGRLTLEAVAERAGLSKGGLLYNFPTKDALLQAMIQRLVDEVSAEREALRGRAEPGRNLEARLCTAALLKLREGRRRSPTACWRRRPRTRVCSIPCARSLRRPWRP